VLLYISPYRRADNVDFKVVLSRPLESVFCQSRCETQMPQLFRNFSVDQLQDVSRQTIFQIGNLPVLLDFEPAGRYFLQLWRFTMKDIPHGRLTLFLARLSCARHRPDTYCKRTGPVARFGLYRGNNERRAEFASRNFWRISELCPFRDNSRFLIAPSARLILCTSSSTSSSRGGINKNDIFLGLEFRVLMLAH
jgi:hypothetical protein